MGGFGPPNAMADIVRTLEVPNRVPGKLVFGRRRVLATFAEPAEVPALICPPAAATGTDLESCQSVAGIHISVNTAKEVIDNTDGSAPSNPSVGTTKEIDAGPGDAPADPGVATTLASDCNFPTVESVAQSSTPATGSTSHTVNLPATIAAGETLIGIIAIDGASGGVTWPAGWTEIKDRGGSGSTDSLGVAWRKADGAEGATITVTTVGTVESVSVVYRISGAADPTVTPPQIAATDRFGTSTSPNPDFVLPTEFGQSGAFLFIAFYAGNLAGPTTACPAGYGNDQSHAIAEVHIGACDKLELKTGSENPGGFTKTGSAHWTASVLVVYPA